MYPSAWSHPPRNKLLAKPLNQIHFSFKTDKPWLGFPNIYQLQEYNTSTVCKLIPSVQLFILSELRNLEASGRSARWELSDDFFLNYFDIFSVETWLVPEKRDLLGSKAWLYCKNKYNNRMKTTIFWNGNKSHTHSAVSLSILPAGLVELNGTTNCADMGFNYPIHKRWTAIRTLEALLAYGNYDCLNVNSATCPDM